MPLVSHSVSTSVCRSKGSELETFGGRYRAENSLQTMNVPQETLQY
jgi:hypothetical protein